LDKRTKKFITKAQELYPEYNYDKTVCGRNLQFRVTVTCSEHGDFMVVPKTHLRGGSGCPECGKAKRIASRLSNTTEFISKARIIYGDKYDYSKVVYVNSATPVIIVCPEHGEYLKTPGNHLNNHQGCPICGNLNGANKNTMPQDVFLNRVKEIHPEKYDLTETEYHKINQPVEVRCIEHNLIFDTVASNLLSGVECCPECAKRKHQLYIDTQRIDWQTFLDDSTDMHHDKYAYEVPDRFELQSTILNIKCPTHGWFTQAATDHRTGRGCPSCGDAKSAASKRKSLEKFIEQAVEVHGDKFDYSHVHYRNNNYPIKLRCVEHDELFTQSPYAHLRGYMGCPQCSHGVSKAETEICTLLDTLNISYIRNDRNIIKPKELDIVIPSHNIAIEYCGNYWHSELQGKGRKYHLDKYQRAMASGYRLLTIFEDEWINKNSIVVSRLKNILGKSEHGVGARKLNIHEIDFQTARDFCNTYHIQGSTKHMKYRLGAFNGEQLVAIMTFNPSRKSLGGSGDGVELVRFATDGKTYAGIASKLLKHFQRGYHGFIISYADLRWSDGDLYKKLGFDLSHISPPNYWYMHVDSYTTRKHRFGFRKAVVVEMFDANPERTEWEIMKNNGYDRIWDCGNLKFTLQSNIGGH